MNTYWECASLLWGFMLLFKAPKHFLVASGVLPSNSSRQLRVEALPKEIDDVPYLIFWVICIMTRCEQQHVNRPSEHWYPTPKIQMFLKFLNFAPDSVSTSLRCFQFWLHRILENSLFRAGLVEVARNWISRDRPFSWCIVSLRPVTKMYFQKTNLFLSAPEPIILCTV